MRTYVCLFLYVQIMGEWEEEEVSKKQNKKA